MTRQQSFLCIILFAILAHIGFYFFACEHLYNTTIGNFVFSHGNESEYQIYSYHTNLSVYGLIFIAFAFILFIVGIKEWSNVIRACLFNFLIMWTAIGLDVLFNFGQIERREETSVSLFPFYSTFVLELFLIVLFYLGFLFLLKYYQLDNKNFKRWIIYVLVIKLSAFTLGYQAFKSANNLAIYHEISEANNEHSATIPLALCSNTYQYVDFLTVKENDCYLKRYRVDNKDATQQDAIYLSARNGSFIALFNFTKHTLPEILHKNPLEQKKILNAFARLYEKQYAMLNKEDWLTLHHPELVKELANQKDNKYAYKRQQNIFYEEDVNFIHTIALHSRDPALLEQLFLVKKNDSNKFRLSYLVYRMLILDDTKYDKENTAFTLEHWKALESKMNDDLFKDN